MRVVCDIEANRLVNPTQIWVILCKDIDTGEYHTFRKVTQDAKEAKRFEDFAAKVDLWIGHNWLEYDRPTIQRLVGIPVGNVPENNLDTLILSRLIDYSRKSHALENFGEEFQFPKIKFSDFSKYSEEMEVYCRRDVDITHKVYTKYLKYILNKKHKAAIELEHSFQLVVNDLHTNGFNFNKDKAEKMLAKIKGELEVLDVEIHKAYPKRSKLIREITPKLTKHGTLSRSDFRWVTDGDLSDFNGYPFSRFQWVDFNPDSHKQRIEVLHDAGWNPVDKTDTHKDTERELSKLDRERKRSTELDLARKACYDKLEQLKKYGWQINETNLDTLPPTAPAPARNLAKRILLESRRRTLTEWLDLVSPVTGRIHGDFYGIGAWTHRMAHRRPNTANIPNEFDTDGKKKPYGKEMRSLWQAPKNRLLCGVDAEGIQLRIFAHYVDNPELTHALINGKKEDKTDPHSYNQRVLGDVCKSRAAAKRFLYALFLGAGMDKLASILGCERREAEAALDRLLIQYPGFETLKSTIIPGDAKRGWFEGLDGRSVRIPGDDVGYRRHLAMSGYLQNGEAVIMKRATIKWYPYLKEADALLVDMVHDEWQTETANDREQALWLAEKQAVALREVGEELNLKCPMAGSYWNDHGEPTIGSNWSVTH